MREKRNGGGERMIRGACSERAFGKIQGDLRRRGKAGV